MTVGLNTRMAEWADSRLTHGECSAGVITIIDYSHLQLVHSLGKCGPAGIALCPSWAAGRWSVSGPGSLLQSPSALQNQTWFFLLQVQARDPAMATRTLTAEDQVSLCSLFPDMTLWTPRAIPISACGLKIFCPSQYWERRGL